MLCDLSSLQDAYRVSLSDIPEEGRQGLVFGTGPLLPHLMLIGEAPGEQEVLEGKPFVGKAGKNLNAFLEATHLNRDEIYITNVVKYRPTQPGKNGRVKNRTPDRGEILRGAQMLIQEISLVRPACIATLGNTPLHALAGFSVNIGDVHGSFVPCNGFSIFALYHPASVIYNRSLSEIYQKDLQKLADYLQKEGKVCRT